MTDLAVVFVHRFGGSRLSFDGVIARLGGDVRTLAFDLPGFGTQAGASGPYTVDAYADFVAARTSGLSFVLVGHSMGGKVALALAARQPKALRALVLLASSPPTPEPIADAERVRAIDGWATYGAASETLAAITGRPLPDDLRRVEIDDMMRASKAAWNAWLEHGSREDISARMDRVAVPVTVVSGTCDPVVPTALQHRLVSMLPDARLVTVPGAGHLLPIEDPDAVTTAVEDAVATCGRPVLRELSRAIR